MRLHEFYFEISPSGRSPQEAPSALRKARRNSAVGTWERGSWGVWAGDAEGGGHPGVRLQTRRLFKAWWASRTVCW